MCDIYIFYILKKYLFIFQILYEFLVKTELHHLSFSFSSLQPLTCSSTLKLIASISLIIVFRCINVCANEHNYQLLILFFGVLSIYDFRDDHFGLDNQ